MTSTNIYSAIPAIQSKTEVFINKARAIHGDLYNYSLVEYILNNMKVKIICHEHGEFKQTPFAHLHNQGCKECANNKKFSNFEKFINKATTIHGDLYNYEFVEYIKGHSKIKIECKIHGIFEQSPTNHLSGNGCKKCAYIHKEVPLEIQQAKSNARCAKRRFAKLNATPKWCEIDLIKQLHIDCKLISEMTGIKHHVDHIVPLQSEIVRGLHCIANLQIITASENHNKCNYYWPDMP